MRSLLEPLIREAGVREVARRADLHQPDLSAWLNGRRAASDEKIDAICDALGVRLRVVKGRTRVVPTPTMTPKATPKPTKAKAHRRA